MRIRHNPNALPVLQQRQDIVVFKPQFNKGKWQTYFKNNNPVLVELGMGRGQFVTTHAYNNPDKNYIGIEKKHEVVLTALERTLGKELDNIALVPMNINFILDVFSEGEIDTLYINFCDPWPKDRHAKRRLTHRLFLEMYKKIIKRDGVIEFKTDNKDLFDFSLEEFKESGFQLTEVTYDLESLQDAANVPTEYEQKYMEMGIKINRLKAVMK